MGVDVGEFYPAQLLHPEPGGDEQGDDGLIADAEIGVAEMDILLAYLEHGVHLVVGVGLDLAVARGAQLQAQGRVVVEVLLGLGPVEQGLHHLTVVVDGGRGRLLKGGALGGRPAVLLGGHVAQEVPDVLAGDGFRPGPALAAGIPLEVAEQGAVEVAGVFGEVRPAGEVDDEVAQCGLSS